MDFDLEDLLECAVCLDTLSQQNKVLPCQHTFCTQCLQDIHNKHGYIHCPECRVLVPGDIQSLPPNVLLNRMLERFRIVDKQGSPTNISGKAKDERNTATKQTQIKVQGSSARQSTDKCLVTLTPSNYENVAAQASIKERFNCSESIILPPQTSRNIMTSSLTSIITSTTSSTRHDQVVTNPNSSTVLNTSLVPSTVLLSTSTLVSSASSLSRSQVSSQPVTSLTSTITSSSVSASSWATSPSPWATSVNASPWANTAKNVPVTTIEDDRSSDSHDKFAPLRMLNISQDQSSASRRHTVCYNPAMRQDGGIIERRNLSLGTQSLTSSPAHHHVPGNPNTNPFLEVGSNSNINTQKDPMKESQAQENMFKDWQLSPRAILNPLPAEPLNKNSPGNIMATGGYSSNSINLPVRRENASASPILQPSASAISFLLPNASANPNASGGTTLGPQHQLNTTSMQNLIFIQPAKPNHQSLQHAKPNHQSLQHAKPNHQSLQHAKPNHQSLQHAKPNHQSLQLAKPNHQSLQHAKPNHQSPQPAKPNYQSQQHAKPNHPSQPQSLTQNALQRPLSNLTTTKSIISENIPQLYSNIHPTNSSNYQYTNIQPGMNISSTNSLPAENKFGESRKLTSQLQLLQPHVSHSSSSNQSVSQSAKNQQSISLSAISQQSISQSSNSQANVQGVYEAICDYTAKKGDELSLTRGEKYLLTEVFVDGWARGKNLRTATYGVLPLNQLRKYSSTQGVKDELDSTGEDRLEKLKKMRETLNQNHAQSLANASSNNNSNKVKGERYRCIVPFPASSDFELSLQMGDVISLVRSREDGWCKGIQHRTGKTGLFPASFVERIG